MQTNGFEGHRFESSTNVCQIQESEVPLDSDEGPALRTHKGHPDWGRERF